MRKLGDSVELSEQIVLAEYILCYLHGVYSR